MGSVQMRAPQVLHWGHTEMATKHVLNRARADVERRGNVADADTAIPVVVDKHQCASQQRWFRFGFPHLLIAYREAKPGNELAADDSPDTIGS